MTDLRLKEVAEKAISYIIDNGEIADFLEDRDLDLTEEEKDYFGIPTETEEDDYWDDPIVNEGWHQQDVIDMYRREG